MGHKHEGTSKPGQWKHSRVEKSSGINLPTCGQSFPVVNLMRYYLDYVIVVETYFKVQYVINVCENIHVVFDL